MSQWLLQHTWRCRLRGTSVTAVASPTYMDLCWAKDALGPHQWTFNALLRHAMAGYSYNEWIAELNYAREEVDGYCRDSVGDGTYETYVERQEVAEGVVGALNSLSEMRYGDPNHQCATCVRNGLADYFFPIETVLRRRNIVFNLPKFISASLDDIAPLLENKDERP